MVQSAAMRQPIWDFANELCLESPDETAIRLGEYFDLMPDEKMQQYSPDWTNQQLMAWDSNFREDGKLTVPRGERNVGIDEYRKVLEQAVEYRNLVRPLLRW